MMGYQMARSIAEHADVVVATHCFFRNATEKYGGLGRAEPSYLDVHSWTKRTNALVNRFKLGTASSTLVSFPLAIAFERAVWQSFRGELSEGRFDLVHRLTPQSSALPSPLASWSPVPFVIGPINGGLPYPKQFSREFRQEGEWLRLARGAVSMFPYVRSTYRNSAAILASGQHTIDRLPVRDRTKVFNLMELGFDPATFLSSTACRPHGRERLTFIFVGRLIPFKCPRIAIAAFGASPLLRRHRLLIVGDGPDRGMLEEQVRSLGLESTVEFAGTRSNAEVGELMQSSDVFVFPSIRESGGLVVVEAMASALACVVIDYGGPGNALTHECGIKVPLGSAEELISGFRDKLEELAVDGALRDRLATAARKRAYSLFTWDAKARILLEVYRWVLGHRPDKPDLDAARNEGA